MALQTPSRVRFATVAYGSLYLLAIVFVVVTFLSWKIPVYGYGWLPQFGERFEAKMTDSFRENAHYLVTSEWGYDGQLYAQLACDPLILNPDTPGAFDNFQFRARRALFPALAYLAGAGQPNAVLQAYCVLNLVIWAMLSVLLVRWLPPVSLQNAFRYLAVLFSAGLVVSLERSLLDGPALLLVALGVLFVEQKRDWLAAVTLGLAGLGKETSVFAASSLRLPSSLDLKQYALLGARLLVVAAPFVIWSLYISRFAEEGSSTLGNSDNFSLPLIGWWKGVQVLLSRIESGENLKYSLMTAGFLFAMPIQILCMFAVRQWDNPWWRVGATYAVFSLFLGLSVWGDLIGSITRVCLPVTVAFNIILPRTTRWLPVLILGNLLSVVGFTSLRSHHPPVVNQLATINDNASIVGGFEWGEGWLGMEQDANNYWLWAKSESMVLIDNVSDAPASATLRFKTRALHPTRVSVALNGEPIGEFDSGIPFSEPVPLKMLLVPGKNELRFKPDYQLLPGDRPLIFMLYNPKLQTEQ